MISGFLSEKPTEKSTKYLLFFSFPLLIITASTVMYLLRLSNFPGTLNETQLGFNGEYIKPFFSRMSDIGYSISIFGITAACCDGIENIFLLMMASNPVNFPNWWAIGHSCFAVAKFIQMYAAIGGIILMALVMVLSRLTKWNVDKGGL